MIYAKLLKPRFNVNGDSLPNWKTSNNFLFEHIYISSIKLVTRKFRCSCAITKEKKCTKSVLPN